MTKERKGTDLLRGLNDIPEEWIEKCYKAETDEYLEKSRGEHVRNNCFRRTAVKWAVAALAVLLLCGGGVAYAAKVGLLPGKKKEMQFEVRNRAHYGNNFSLQIEAEKILSEELTGDIHETEEFMRNQMAEEDYDKEYPSWVKHFKTVEEARIYIGYDGLKETEMDAYRREVYVVASGDEAGNLAEVALVSQFIDGKISICEVAEVYTENGLQDKHGKVIFTTDDREIFRHEVYVTKNGTEVSFVYEEREYDEDGNRWMMASLMDGAVYYELCSIYYPKDYERAKEIMLQWCEQF